MSHTPEPWLQGAECLTLIHRQSGEMIATTKTAEDARRIVACVNACAGIATEGLERGTPIIAANKLMVMMGDQLNTENATLRAALHTQAEEAAKLIEQRDGLLAACVEFVRKCDAGEARSISSYLQMKAAIEKATN